jgi:glycerol-3-phosphate acyltransferase PlsY
LAIMPSGALDALTPLAAYAAGCFVTAYYLVLWKSGQDIRTLGSGNPGARNAGRVLGKPGFAAVLLIDAGKGSAAVLGARALGVGVAVMAVAMVAVVIGHVWPAQLQFRGGKGAATALGILVAYDLRVALTLVPVFLVLLAVTRSLSKAGLPSFVAAPLATIVNDKPLLIAAALTVVAVVVVFAHRPRAIAA